MNFIKIIERIFVVVLIALTVLGCNGDQKSGNEYISGEKSLGKILVVHSYSTDYEWVNDISDGIRDTFDGKNVELEFYCMDTKKKTNEAWKEESGKIALKKVADWQPDVVIAVDDNAQIYFARNLVGEEKPMVVFCGVNGDPSEYGYPAKNVTGILERPHFTATLQQFKRIVPTANRIAVISDNSVTSAGAIEYMKTQKTEFDIVSWNLPSTFAEWQRQIKTACNNADAIAIYTYHTLRSEIDSTTSTDPQKVIEWTVTNSTIPIIGFFDFGIENGWLYGSVESGYEHGSEAGQIALGLLSGKNMRDFPIKTATKATSMLNLAAAEKLGIQIPEEIIENTDIVIGKK
jgi:ABC-type uncharacterized transport system substrate-binding protein